MSRWLLLLTLLLVFLYRVQLSGGLSKPEPDPFIENLTSKFEAQRFYLSQIAQSILPQPQAGLLVGMVLGIKEDLPSEFKKALQKTSTMHIVVVSGQNLTLLGGFLITFVSLIGRKKTLILTLIFLIVYSIFTGLQIPVLRAVVMFGFASIAQILGREEESFWILILTALLMLIYNPNWLMSISFQLSFLATVGVVVLAPEMSREFRLIPDILRQDLTMTTAAQLMVLPIIATSFHQLSLVGILVNSLILFTVPIIMVTGMITLLISLLSPNLGQIFALIPGAFLTYFVYIVEFFNNDWASLYVKKLSPLVWIGYYLIILGLYLSLRRKNEAKSLHSHISVK